MSSLLVALQEPQWYARVETYECSEAEYVAEVEKDLFQLEMDMTKTMFGQVLHTLPLTEGKAHDVS